MTPSLLIIDDYPDFWLPIQHCLHLDAAADVKILSSASEAQTFLQDLANTPQLILVDCLMPEIDGIGFMKWLEIHRADLMDGRTYLCTGLTKVQLNNYFGEGVMTNIHTFVKGNDLFVAVDGIKQLLKKLAGQH